MKIEEVRTTQKAVTVLLRDFWPDFAIKYIEKTIVSLVEI
jgi:hypothetical protein